MTETTRLAYRTTTFDLRGETNPLSADRGRRVTIRPHTVEVTEWPDGRVYVTVQGQTIRQDGTRGSTRRCIRYRREHGRPAVHAERQDDFWRYLKRQGKPCDDVSGEWPQRAYRERSEG